MSEGEWALAAVHDVVAAAVPDREMLVCGGGPADLRRGAASAPGGWPRSWRRRGIGLRRERAELERWECGQDAVALILHNGPEYIEAMLGAYRARAVPFNVNQHYRAGRARRACSTTSAPGRSCTTGARAAARPRPSARPTSLLIDVDDGSGVEPAAGQHRLRGRGRRRRSARRSRSRRPTTSTWCAPAARPAGRRPCCGARPTSSSSAMAGVEGATAESIARRGRGRRRGALVRRRRRSCTPPRSGRPSRASTAARRSCSTTTRGPSTPARDPRAGRARAGLHDVDRRRRLRAGPWSTSCARAQYDRRSLVMHRHRRRGDERPPEGGAARAAARTLTIVDGYGASETGGMAFGARDRGGAAARASRPAPGAAVLVGRPHAASSTPGDDEIGWTARRGRVPLGYLGDREKHRGDVPDHRRRAGRRPRRPGPCSADGSIRMLGRDSMVVNTGGEKVFVEEVEAVLRTPPRRRRRARRRPADASASARRSSPSCSSAPGATLDPAELREFVGGRHRPLQGAAGDRRVRRASSATPAARPTTAGPVKSGDHRRRRDRGPRRPIRRPDRHLIDVGGSPRGAQRRRSARVVDLAGVAQPPSRRVGARARPGSRPCRRRASWRRGSNGTTRRRRRRPAPGRRRRGCTAACASSMRSSRSGSGEVREQAVQVAPELLVRSDALGRQVEQVADGREVHALDLLDERDVVVVGGLGHREDREEVGLEAGSAGRRGRSGRPAAGVR